MEHNNTNIMSNKKQQIALITGSSSGIGFKTSLPIPTVNKNIPVMNIPNNLGIIIKSKELDGFIPIIDRKISENRSFEEE